MIRLDIGKTLMNHNRPLFIHNRILFQLCFAICVFLTNTHTTDDEVGVEDAQGGLVGILLIVYGCGDDQAKRDARHTLQDDQSYDQHQGTLVRDLGSEEEGERDGERERWREREREREKERDGQREEVN